ncbi:hypothetical protein ACHAW6_008135 [Cyclotella cf. meneghiniana]
MNDQQFQVVCTQSIVYCKVFKVTLEYILLGLIKILPISNKDMIADELTKPLAQNAICKQ